MEIFKLLSLSLRFNGCNEAIFLFHCLRTFKKNMSLVLIFYYSPSAQHYHSQYYWNNHFNHFQPQKTSQMIRECLGTGTKTSPIFYQCWSQLMVPDPVRVLILVPIVVPIPNWSQSFKVLLIWFRSWSWINVFPVLQQIILTTIMITFFIGRANWYYSVLLWLLYALGLYT